MNPKVFVSHANEDKNRFVLSFAKRLRDKGIDAWLDRWEMSPGDSLVRKIFEEGLKEANAVIVILSQYSVSKPWVREELDAAMVKKIEQATKLIPIVIEECDIPECLKTILWERVYDLEQYDQEFERIVMSIYGHREKPPLGSPPAYVNTSINTIGQLTRVDSIILKVACEIAIEHAQLFIETDQVLSRTATLGLPEQEVRDSLEILDQESYLELLQVFSGPPPNLTVSLFGFDRCANNYVENYEKIFTNVIAQIINENLKDSVSIAKNVGAQRILVDHILHVLENQGCLRLSEKLSGGVFLYNVSPKLKRALEGK